MTKIAINGLGRMGKLALRSFLDLGLNGEIVLLNESQGDPEQHALLLEFDTVHGRWKADISHGQERLTINGHTMRLTRERRIEDLPLAALGVDVVVDCTGVFKTGGKVRPDFDAGVTKVVVSAPVKDGGAANIVYGVNHRICRPEEHHLVTAAAEGELKGILGCETRPLVSCDYLNDERSSIVDALSTMVVNGTQVKVYAWYDNEYGYAFGLADVTGMVVASLQ